MKISTEEIEEEIKNSTKEQDILRRVFSLFMDSHWNDHKLIPTYCQSIKFPRNLGRDINSVVQKNFPKWYTKQVKINKSKERQ